MHLPDYADSTPDPLLPPAKAALPLVQRFHSPESRKSIGIKVQVDANTGAKFVLWRHIQEEFPNVRKIKDGDVRVDFMMDDEYEDLQASEAESPSSTHVLANEQETAAKNNFSQPFTSVPGEVIPATTSTAVHIDGTTPQTSITDPLSRSATTEVDVPKFQPLKRPVVATVQTIVECSLGSETNLTEETPVFARQSIASSPLNLIPDSFPQERGQKDTAASPFSAPFSSTSSLSCATAENNAFGVSETIKSKATKQVDSNPSRGPCLSVHAVSYLEQLDFGKALGRHLKDLGEPGQHMIRSYNGMISLYAKALLTGERANAERYERIMDGLLQTFFNTVTNGSEGLRGSGQHDELLSKEMLRMQQEFLDSLAALQRRVHALLNKTYEFFNEPRARLFIVLPVGPEHLDTKNLAKNKFRVYYLCDCSELQKPSATSASPPSSSSPLTPPPHIHFAKHEGYELLRPNTFFFKYGFHVLTIMEMVRYGITTPSFVVPEFESLEVLRGIEGFKNHDITRESFKRKLDDTIGYIKKRMPRSSSIGDSSGNALLDRSLDFSDLFKLHSFLKCQMPGATTGNLFRTTTTAGHVKWICFDHYRVNYQASEAEELDTLLALRMEDLERRDLEHVPDTGSYDEQHGFVVFLCGSPSSAHQLYKRLQVACGVNKLHMVFLWHATKDDIQSLCEAVQASNVSLLYVTFKSESQQLLSSNANRLRPIVDLIDKGKIQGVSLELEFLDSAMGLGGTALVGLRELHLQVGSFSKQIKENFFRFLSRLTNLSCLSLECSDLDNVYSTIQSRLREIPNLSSLRLWSKQDLAELDLKARTLKTSGIFRGLERIVQDFEGLRTVFMPFKSESIAFNIHWVDRQCAYSPLAITLELFGGRGETIVEVEFRSPVEVSSYVPATQRLQGENSLMYIKWCDDDTPMPLAEELNSTASDLHLSVRTLKERGIRSFLDALAGRKIYSITIECCLLADNLRWLAVSAMNLHYWMGLTRLEIGGSDIEPWILSMARIITRTTAPLLQTFAIAGESKQRLSESVTWIEFMLLSDPEAASLLTIQLKNIHLSSNNWNSLTSVMDLSRLKVIDLTGSSIQKVHCENIFGRLPSASQLETVVLTGVDWTKSLSQCDRDNMLAAARTKAWAANIQF
ncbi:hypothetical protein BGZ58_008617 [Dissophora ornata]|nr:hypothetical protein BGZ58_008617 [Dissophora ornata]